jgi:hypothetical protein
MSSEIIGCVVRAGAEGVPINAIARAMELPYDKVLLYLQRARKLGAISELSRPDWPATTTTTTRAPAVAQTVDTSHRSPRDTEFLCRHVFRLTNLEAGFLVVLLRSLFAEKEKLHAVIEQQRAARPLRPLQQEVTDPKMVDVMICKLRKKLSGVSAPFLIRTSWGKGYFLDQSVKDGIYRMLDVGVADLAHAGGVTPDNAGPGAPPRQVAHAGSQPAQARKSPATGNR